MKINFKNKNRGVTLVEVLVYIGIFSIFIGSIVVFQNMMTTSRVNNQISLEVNNQGNEAVRIMTQAIRNASSITSPSSGNASSNLILATSNGSTNPTVFAVNSGVLSMTEGTGATVPLTNNKVTVSNITFSNLSQSSTAENIKIYFTLDSLIPNSANIIRSVSFYGSASLRK